MTKATKRTRVRRGTGPRGEVRRNEAGEVEMITLKRFRDNPLAPTALVSDIGGIYRVDRHLIRCTFIDDVPNAEGVLETVAQSHLVWKSEANWLDSHATFRWIMSEFRRSGIFQRGGLRPQ